MWKEYRSSNVRFCMDDENQRRTWEYLQSITRKEGSYGKILSDALMLSRLVDTFFSRTSWTMLLYAENHSISVA